MYKGVHMEMTLAPSHALDLIVVRVAALAVLVVGARLPHLFHGLALGVFAICICTMSICGTVVRSGARRGSGVTLAAVATLFFAGAAVADAVIKVAVVSPAA
jgi:hypothetical protein